MIWASWTDFFAMGGYAFYVWGSYGLALLLMVGEVVLVRNRRRTLLQRLSLIQKSSVGEENETAS
jgi:heme exporter protein D